MSTFTPGQRVECSSSLWTVTAHDEDARKVHLTAPGTDGPVNIRVGDYEVRDLASAVGHHITMLAELADELLGERSTPPARRALHARIEMREAFKEVLS